MTEAQEKKLKQMWDYSIDPKTLTMKHLPWSILLETVNEIIKEQRHQLKEQVLEAIGKKRENDYTRDSDYLRPKFKLIDEGYNEAIEEIKQRIEAVFKEV